MTTSQAPSLNFTIAKISTTISDVSPAAKVITRLYRQPRLRGAVVKYRAIPKPASVNAVKTPSA